MATPTKTLTLAACLALSLGGLFSIHAQDAPAGRRGGGGGFGLRGPGSQVIVANTPSFRGMVKKVIHLVDFEEIEAQAEAKK